MSLPIGPPNISDAAARYPNAAFSVCRKSFPRWENAAARRSGSKEHSRTVLSHGVTVCYQRKRNRNMQIHPDDVRRAWRQPVPCARECLIEAGISFRKDLGPSVDGEQVRYEEVLLLRQLVEKGFPGIHIPTAIVYHRNSSERMTEKYVREYLVGEGIALARMEKLD